MRHSTKAGRSPIDHSTPPPLRRSKRKLAASMKEDSTVFDSPPPTTKKPRKAKKDKKDSTECELEPKPPATLMSLNYDVQDKLLQYLDVQVSSSDHRQHSGHEFDLQSAVSGSSEPDLLPFRPNDQRTLPDYGRYAV